MHETSLRGELNCVSLHSRVLYWSPCCGNCSVKDSWLHLAFSAPCRFNVVNSGTVLPCGFSGYDCLRLQRPVSESCCLNTSCIILASETATGVSSSYGKRLFVNILHPALNSVFSVSLQEILERLNDRTSSSYAAAVPLLLLAVLPSVPVVLRVVGFVLPV